MGPVNYLAVLLAALSGFLVGGLWYGPLFGKAWQREHGLSDAALAASNKARIFGLGFLCLLIIAWILGHNFARLQPPFHVKLMIASGMGGALIAPAIGLNYLFALKSLKLFLIDAGYFLVTLSLMGLVFALMG